MASDNIAKIKDRLSVVDLISGYIKVQKAGVNYKARCPFHNEKTPSFYISPERQIWHCFGCGVGGDIFGFVKQIEGVEFPEALRILAQRAGIKLESYDPAAQDAKTVLYEICETAARFFEKQLYYSPIGKKALAYLKDRGLHDDTIKEFCLGFAPDDWHALGKFLRDCGYKEKDIVDSGLALKREDGSEMYDRFRSRIIFPIADINDRIVGFTGRVFEETSGKQQETSREGLTSENDLSLGHLSHVAKYINSPQTLIYDKSRILYGLNKAKLETRRADRCLLVEGNMDAIMSYQAGVKNVAATSGTALTPSHLQLLQRYTSNLDFCFDTDQAGLVATRRGIGLALSQNLNIKIVHLNDPQCKDPADYVKKFGQKWAETVKIAKPVIDFYFEKLKSELNLNSVEGKKVIVANLGPLVRRLVSNIERAHWVSKIAALLKTKEDAVEADLLTAKDDLDVYGSYESEIKAREKITPELSNENIFEEAILAVILKKPSLFINEIKQLNDYQFSPLVNAVVSGLNAVDLGNFKFSDFAETFNDDIKMKLDFANLKSQEALKDFSDDDLKTEFYSLKNKLDKKSVVAELAVLALDIKTAEADRDREKLVPLMAKFSDLTKKLKN